MSRLITRAIRWPLQDTKDDTLPLRDLVERQFPGKQFLKTG